MNQNLKIEKGCILKARREHRENNCVHYVIFLEMCSDGKSFIGACISSKETKSEDIISNEEMHKDHFFPCTPENGYKVTYGNCSDGCDKSYLCKCPFEKDLIWFVTEQDKKIEIVGKLTEEGVLFVEKQLEGKPPVRFNHPINEINNYPQLITNL